MKKKVVQIVRTVDAAVASLEAIAVASLKLMEKKASLGTN